MPDLQQQEIDSQLINQVKLISKKLIKTDGAIHCQVTTGIMEMFVQRARINRIFFLITAF